MSELVILCHLARQDIWTPVLPFLEGAHTVSFRDVPGFGNAPLPPRPVSVAAMAAALQPELHSESHVVGLSMAGSVALEIGRIGDVAGVTAISPPGFWTSADAAWITAQVGSMWSAVRFTRPLVTAAGRSDRLRREVWRRLVANPDALPAEVEDAMLYGIPANLRHITADPRDLGSFARAVMGLRIAPLDGDVPVSVLWGDRDTFTSYRRQAQAARAVLPHARHVTLRGCGHIPLYDDPEQVAEAILESVARA